MIILKIPSFDFLISSKTILKSSYVCEWAHTSTLQGLCVSIIQNAEPKLVNKRRILVWDIPAMNGVIHIIEGPLKAPPQIVSDYQDFQNTICTVGQIGQVPE